jgi:hypothetical protein
MRDALDAAIVLDDAGFESEILWEAIDDYSDAGFMKVARDVTCEADVTTMAAVPVLDAFWDQVEALIGPFEGHVEECAFDGISEEWGVF